MHPDQSVYFHFYDTVLFKMKLHALVTKYTDTLTFNFAPTINPKWSIMALEIFL